MIKQIKTYDTFIKQPKDKDIEKEPETQKHEKDYNTIRQIVLSNILLKNNYLSLEYIMEVIASASEEALINPLNIESPKAASYITSRRSVTFHPQGGSRYRATEGAQVI
jgi:hypothetical protein